MERLKEGGGEREGRKRSPPPPPPSYFCSGPIFRPGKTRKPRSSLFALWKRLLRRLTWNTMSILYPAEHTYMYISKVSTYTYFHFTYMYIGHIQEYPPEGGGRGEGWGELVQHYRLLTSKLYKIHCSH